MRRLVPVLAAAAVLAAGCSDDADPVAGPAPTTAAPASPSASASVPATRPTRPARPTAKPGPTKPAETVEAPCPYADRDTMAGTVGQHLERITVTKTTPYVGCAYYRPNGEKAVTIEVSVLDSAAAAKAKAAATAGGTANPVDVADGGSVAVVSDGTLIGVSEGTKLVVVKINQRVPIEAIEIAKFVVAKI